MKKIFLLLFIVACNFCNAPNAFQSAIDSLFNLNYSDTTVGVSIGLIYYNPNTGEYVQDYYFYGEKDRSTHLPPDSLTVYQIGSVTKTFTAMVMAYMLHYGMATRDDLIQSY